MGYRENVEALCFRLNIPNDPHIEEDDLLISAVWFEVDGEWIKIDGTKWNRAGRLFFQSIYTRVPGARELVIGPVLRYASEFFAENWLDAESVGRPMLVALKKARCMMFDWK